MGFRIYIFIWYSVIIKNMSEQSGTWWIWKFWILLVVVVEVILGIIKPEVLINNSLLGTSLLNLIL